MGVLLRPKLMTLQLRDKALEACLGLRICVNNEAMRPVDGDTDNDCFRACIASLLELELHQVPHFIEMPDWPLCVNAWFSSIGFPFRLLAILASAHLEYISDAFMIVSGRGLDNVSHAVIFYEGELVHDPSPLKQGIGEVEMLWLLIPTDPSLFVHL